MLKMFFPEKIEEYRKKHKISIKNFCKMCDISLLTYKKMMTHDYSFKATAVVKVARVMGVHPGSLCENDKDKIEQYYYEIKKRG